MIVLRNKEFAFLSSDTKIKKAIQAMDNIKNHWDDTQFVERTIPDIYHGIRVYKTVRVPYTFPKI
jgi:hypothetical protein